MSKRTLLAGLLLSVVAGPAWLHARSTNVPTDQVARLPAPTDYVSDLANVIDAASKQQIDELCSEIDHQAHAQIAVVTIDSLNGQSIEEFATELEDKWKVGPKGTDRGLLMIFAVKEHKRRIEVGYGLEGILNDAKVGDIGRSMVPQLEQGQYGPAIYGGLQQIAGVTAADAGVTLAQQQQQHTYHVEQRQRGFRLGTIIRIVFFVVILIAAVSGRGRGGNGWLWFLLGNVLGGGGGGGRDRGDGGGGGGGDGFGGFGGGSSGGGGASGDW